MNFGFCTESSNNFMKRRLRREMYETPGFVCEDTFLTVS